MTLPPRRAESLSRHTQRLEVSLAMSSVHTSTRSRVAMLVAATACWGTGTVVTKQVLGSVPPLTLLPLQLASSCVFLLIALKLSRTRVVWSPQTTRLTLLGVLNPGIA